MSDGGARARAMLAAWREQHADRIHPIRFHFMEALERRAAAHDGEARRLLDDKLLRLLDAYAKDVDRAVARADVSGGAITADVITRSALGTLADDIAHCAATRSGKRETPITPSQPSPFPELEVLDDFKKIWSKIRIDSQLRQTLEQVPSNAGPLNSGSLVHRSITLMRELSPGYLQHFLTYVDALSGIEQMNASVTAPSKDAPRQAGTKKRARGKPREPRE
ncbi:DUF2894 domain-containing protein [Dyella sp. 20L07]|uniref:DUF2894 domain-containing protein n=1 Tax=Dyella sp. 20L07 TaxID=3384240 RepID=UPI003D278E12